MPASKLFPNKMPKNVSLDAGGIMNLAAGDYIEAYGRIDDLGGGSGPAFGTRIFQAYKLIGV